MITALMILAGLVLLMVGGDTLVKGSVNIAKRYNISPLVIGIVLVGFGTSSPELSTSLIAAFNDAPGIAVGNVVGSNIANILLILGITTIIAPIAVAGGRGFKRDSAFLIGSVVLFLMTCYVGTISMLWGLIFTASLALYIYIAFKSGEVPEDIAEDINAKPANPMWVDALMFLGGLIGIIYGAKLLVDGAIVVAKIFEVSDTIIGLTIVAVGTSLPELVACVIAALKKHADIAYGNIIGSNIYNILGILGVTGLITPLEIPQQIIATDVWIMGFVTVLLLAFAMTGWKIGRIKGLILVAGYIGYSLYLLNLATTAS